uniref:Uncharacterized protein n=1 Tax=Parascaris univalens TaxID=6257 RepID=A0A915CCA7_PARUN
MSGKRKFYPESILPPYSVTFLGNILDSTLSGLFILYVLPQRRDVIFQRFDFSSGLSTHPYCPPSCVGSFKEHDVVDKAQKWVTLIMRMKLSIPFSHLPNNIFNGKFAHSTRNR